MATLFSSSCSIGSPMAVRPFAFSYPPTPSKAVKVGCFCVVRNDGSPTQAPRGGAAAQVQIKCSFNNKAYEDRMKGIACYIDEMGEITCEGYDEGPRTEAPCLFGHLRDGDVIELLKRSWLQLGKDSRFTMETESSSSGFLN